VASNESAICHGEVMGMVDHIGIVARDLKARLDAPPRLVFDARTVGKANGRCRSSAIYALMPELAYMANDAPLQEHLAHSITDGASAGLFAGRLVPPSAAQRLDQRS
jgi:hypothetical protein